jgi:hypothetical protein
MFWTLFKVSCCKVHTVAMTVLYLSVSSVEQRRGRLSERVALQPNSGLGRLISRVYRSHTHTHTHSVGSPKQVISSLKRTTSTKGRTSMFSEGFESAIPAIERLQTYALDRTASGRVNKSYYSKQVIYFFDVPHCGNLNLMCPILDLFLFRNTACEVTFLLETSRISTILEGYFG